MAQKKSNKSKILRVAIFAFCAYIAVSLTVMQIDISKRKSQLQSVQQEIEEQTYLNQEFENILKFGADSDYIMRIVREKLGYAFPDERVFVDYNRKQ